MPFLPPNQQRQSTESIYAVHYEHISEVKLVEINIFRQLFTRFCAFLSQCFLHPPSEQLNDVCLEDEENYQNFVLYRSYAHTRVEC